VNGRHAADASPASSNDSILGACLVWLFQVCATRSVAGLKEAPLSCSRYQLGCFAIVALVALRIAVGWHFYSQGLKKLDDPKFSSEGFLRQAKGPLAPMYQGMIPDFHGWDAAMDELLADNQAEPKDIRQVLAAKDNPLARWSDQVKQDWGAYVAKAASHYDLQTHPGTRAKTDKDGKPIVARANGVETAEMEACAVDEKAEANEILERQFTKFDDAVKDFRDWLMGHPHELTHAYTLARSKSLDEIPFERPRLSGKEAEVAGEKNKLLADAKKIEKELEADVWDVVPGERRASMTPLPVSESSLNHFDAFLTYSLLAIGVCLMIGLLTRLASIGGAFFLLSVIGTQPPWVYGAIPPYEQTIEMLALLVLAAVGAGRWAGVDFLFSRMCGACCRTKGTSHGS
jgi:uncharacterized membrane protein YphA (DoxX/SURF4 family)